MKLFDSYESLASTLGGVTKWQRTLQAVRHGGPLAEVTYSIGDSLTYRRTQSSTLDDDLVTGRRRYHLVIAPISGPARLDIANKADLTPQSPYSDLTDRQFFLGSGNSIDVPPGAVLIADIDEAVRVHRDPDVEVIVLHVTVEGATFANK